MRARQRKGRRKKKQAKGSLPLTYFAGVWHIAVCHCIIIEFCKLQKGVRGEGEGEGWLVGLVGVGSTLKEHDQRRVTGGNGEFGGGGGCVFMVVVVVFVVVLVLVVVVVVVIVWSWWW